MALAVQARWGSRVTSLEAARSERSFWSLGKTKEMEFGGYKCVAFAIQVTHKLCC